MSTHLRRVWAITVLLVAAGLGTFVWLRPASAPAAPGPGPDRSRSKVVDAGAIDHATANSASSTEPSTAAGARREIIGAGWTKPSPSAFAAFQDWTKRYLAAAPARRGALLTEGLALARTRRAALAELIRRDPAAALAQAVPMDVRGQLPSDVVALLETRVAGEGELALNALTPAPGQVPAEALFRSALIGRDEYRAYVYGERANQRSVPKTYINGIAVDRDLAVADLARLVLADGHNHDAADNAPGTSTVANRPSQAWTHGQKKVLIILIDFSDIGAPVYPSGNVPITDDYAVNLFNAANGITDFYAQSSYGKTSLAIAPTVAGDSPDVTPVLRMPQTAASYATAGSNTLLHSDARALAATAGYNVDGYDRVGVVFRFIGTSVIPGSQITYGGLGNVEGKNFWVNGWYDFRVVAHEIGHNYGLMHANLWKVTDGNPLSPTGSSLEYGDIYDVMGGGSTPEYDFSQWNKSILQWIPDTAVTVAQAGGTYRIYRFDAAAANLANPRALKIVRDANKDYWVGYRRATTNATLDAGAYVLWGYNTNQQSNLVEYGTPGNSDLSDAGVPIGQTLTDSVAGIAIKPTAQGGSGAEEWLDVQVTFQPRITWSQSSYIAGEQGGSAVLTLKRGYNATGAVSVNYTTAAGTATSPADFTAQSSTVTWADGDVADKTVTIPVVADGTAEGTEAFTVTLSGITGGVIGNSPTATVSIVEPGARDPIYSADFINSTVNEVLPLPDGSVIIGGWFSALQDANYVTYNVSGCARILASGAIDPDFGSEGGTDNWPAVGLARQPDGRILAVGNFSTYNGVARNKIVRIMPDGSVDTSFNPGAGPNGMVYAVVVQPDGKILIGGSFTSVAGTPREYLARLNADGSLDTGFTGPDFAGTSGWSVKALALQPDGLILVGGSFYLSGANLKASICRVTASGALDAGFTGIVQGTYVSGDAYPIRNIERIALQPDGKIVVVGNFKMYNATARSGVARLTVTGALDTGFAPLPNLLADGTEYCNALLVQPDGRILIGGDFTSVDGVACSHLALLSTSGVVDASFAAAGGFSGNVTDLALLPDSRVMLAGDYANFQGSLNGGPLWRFYSSLTGAPGTIQLAAASAAGTEGGAVQLSVTRTGAGVGALTVGYATVNGTATTADFTAAAGVLTWADGDTSAKTITIQLTTDAVADSGETFTVNLGQPLIGGAILGNLQQAVVEVTDPVLTGYSAWQAGKFTGAELLDANISGVAADPDGDGLTNLMEYALDLEPKTANASGLPAVSSDATYWLYTYTRPTDRADLTYSVEYSTNLTTWTSVAIGDLNQTGSTATTQTWQARQPLSTANVFFRLKVTQ